MDSTSNTVVVEDRSIAGLFKALRDETATLFKQEVALAKTEMTEKATCVARNVAYLAVGGLVAYAGVLFILLGLSALLSWGLAAAGLSQAMAFWLGPIIVGIVVGIIGFVLVQKGRATLTQASLKPEKTIQSLQEDKAWTQQKLQQI